MDETGQVFLGKYVQRLGISADYLAAETAAQLATLHTHRAMYTPIRPPISPAGRLVIVVDNGIATGASMIAAVRAKQLPADTRQRFEALTGGRIIEGYSFWQYGKVSLTPRLRLW